MRKLYLIGVGAGDPDHITMQGIQAMNEVDGFFVIGKGELKRELIEVRTAILDKHRSAYYKLIEVVDPPRDREPSDYVDEVDLWHDKRAELLEEQFGALDGVGGLLVWGDPSLYDSTLRMVERVLARGIIDFEYEVIPGITCVSALAARHRIVLNRVGEPVLFTTGRKLREGLPDGVLDAVVMLDSDCSFTTLEPETQIWWGAYLGMPDEVLIAGTIGEVGERIQTERAELRARKGWIMDTYLVRRP
ncbi:precorrin-6A synthase (deacetylating) [Aldersonia kunmingensis]|uniref:precorrin-6A synthase (deacetylating) n=1 Tax=Aldersonia kunmingensis TaxID=408066 RepID=UPI00082CF8D5|nr:precorrin-6A synthase (deacetylating) [Aldersonia kunmingensis]